MWEKLDEQDTEQHTEKEADTVRSRTLWLWVRSKHCDKEEMSLKTCTSAAFLYLGLKAEFYPENVYLCSAL